MKEYASDKLRNVVLLGHGGSGKTTLVESLLFKTGVINRMGQVEKGNTVSDFEKTEIDKGYSIQSSVVPIELNDHKINFIDAPGYFDFVGEIDGAFRAADAAIILVDAAAGVQVGTEKAWALCAQEDMPKIILINKIDKDNLDLDDVVSQIQEHFGTFATTLDDIDTLNEAIAETDDALLEKFFNEEPYTEEEYVEGLSKGIKMGRIAPIFEASALADKGLDELLDFIIKELPAPDCSNDKEISTFIFKTLTDPQAGKVSLMRVMSGDVHQGLELYDTTSEKPEKLSAIYFLQGKNHVEAKNIQCGDIFAASKLQYAKTGDTLATKGSDVIYPTVRYPEPTYFMAIEPFDKNDDEKVGTGLNRLREEDPSFIIERNVETGQTLVGAQGDIQVGIILNKLQDRYGVKAKLVQPKVSYRETIKGSSDVQGKHKKQSGGAGQYGDVHIRFSPSTEDFEFAEELFGGSVPKNYVPAVEKGLKDSMVKGPLTGSPVTGLKAVLYDGSYHDVDSNEMAFKIAAQLAFKKGFEEAKPMLLEPIMHATIEVPSEFMGDVMGDMNKRRGKVLGMEPSSYGHEVLSAEAPLAEMYSYAIALRSMTQARGSFTMKFERYEEVPHSIADKIIAEHQAAHS
ncbi:MAG: elongation factor G [Clostridiales Family XIII bacterium]|jgi:elongation factor G|nr:elongation factor G [Clostridiales Family XIII bacterium]